MHEFNHSISRWAGLNDQPQAVQVERGPREKWINSEMAAITNRRWISPPAM